MLQPLNEQTSQPAPLNALMVLPNELGVNRQKLLEKHPKLGHL